jgi:hypothetical protein
MHFPSSFGRRVAMAMPEPKVCYCCGEELSEDNLAWEITRTRTI